GQGRARHTRFVEAVEETFVIALKRNGVGAGMMLLISIFAFGAITLVLWMGARAVATGVMTGGDLTAMVLYALYAASGFSILGEVYGEVMRAAGAADRVADVRSASPEIQSPQNPVALPERTTGALSFDDITFRYSDSDAAALENISLDVAPGEFVALVGPSGAGKTTVFRLALRLFDPEAGAVRLDGIPAKRCRLEDWRDQFAYAPQDSALFSGSARENIAFGSPSVSDRTLSNAAEMAEASDFLSAKGGLDSEIGQKGRGLSGGQGQRLSLARALVRDAPVLLLDEATNALDSESEAAVQRAIAKAAHGRTTLVIAHRFATVRRADRIIVMDKGRIVEEGSHTSLMAKSGLYARLAELQFGEN
ncbi:MAG: ATP-binding cassette domain-containing protein, partial [Pseudomonadota bacterium]